MSPHSLSSDRLPIAAFTVLAFLLGGTACGSPATEPEHPAVQLEVAISVAAAVTLDQLDVTLDNGSHTNSPWGRAMVAYSGSNDVLYFNLAINGNWRLKNVPVLSREGTGVGQVATLLFDLGVADGIDIASAQSAFELTTDIRSQMPSGAIATGIGTGTWAIGSGTAGRAIVYSPPAPALVGAQAAESKVTHSGFPNQRSDNNECVPVALSNSLQWMNTRYGLGLAAGDISIAAMKAVVDWQASGAGQQWWTKKRTRFKDLLTTSTIPRFNLGEVYDAVARGCDVELRANNHVVSVTAAQKLADGRYSLDLTHDPDQKDGKAPGGEGTQTVIWDPKTKQFSGAPWIEGHSTDLIVVECPKQRT